MKFTVFLLNENEVSLRTPGGPNDSQNGAPWNQLNRWQWFFFCVYKIKFVIKSQASNQCLTQSVALYACVCALARSKASKYIENETNFQHRIKCSRWLLEFQALNLEKCSLSRDRFTWLWSISLRAWEIDWTNVCLCLCLCMLCITIYCLYSTSFNAVKR